MIRLTDLELQIEDIPEAQAADAWRRLNIICEAFIADGHRATDLPHHLRTDRGRRRMRRERSHKMTAIISLTLAGALLAYIALGVTLGWGIDRLWESFIALPLVAAHGITHTYLLGKARR